jgi:HopA1 effector protein family
MEVITFLQDVAKNVQIDSKFCVSHPSYKPLELPAEMVTRFQKMPGDVQHKYLSLQLRSFLYGIYYNGSLQTKLASELESDLANSNLYQSLENNTFLGVDVEFYERLHKSNAGEGYFDPSWQIVKEESDGTLAVIKHGLTLHIERDRHLSPAAQSATVGDTVAIKMPRNLVQNGFYVAVSNLGSETLSNPDNYAGTARIYFNLKAEGAIAIMGSLTQKLKEIQLPFTFKVLYNPSDYGRYDSGVLYFEKINYQPFLQILQTVYTENQSYFQAEVPLFTKLLAPGLALAEEPDRKFTIQESFGMNRCQIVANGLLEARQKGEESPENRLKSVFEQFSLLGIDWQRPYLNSNSEDIYAPLNLC